MLSAKNVSKSFGGFQALSGCSIEIGAQSITGIIGPNGAGKSTLFNIVGGLIPPDAGDITLEGRNIVDLRPDELAQAGLVRTFQISRELGQLTVLENMLLASPGMSGDSVWRNFCSPSRVRAEQQHAIAKARALLEQVNLWQLANEPAKNLSGGQKKLLEISRALMLDPKIILLDEPTAGVSPLMTKVLGETIIKLRAAGTYVRHHRARHGRHRRTVQPDLRAGGGTHADLGHVQEVASNRDVMHAYLGKVA